MSLRSLHETTEMWMIEAHQQEQGASNRVHGIVDGSHMSGSLPVKQHRFEKLSRLINKCVANMASYKQTEIWWAANNS